MLSSSINPTFKNLTMKCNSSSSQVPLDMIYSTRHGPLAVCFRSSESSSSSQFIDLFAESIPDKDKTAVMSFELSSNPWSTNTSSPSDMSLVRFLRLDIDPNLGNDLIMYEIRGNRIFYAQLNKILEMPTNYTISRVKVIKSRFLMIELAQFTTASPSISVSNLSILLDMEFSEKVKSRAMLDQYKDCQKSSAPWGQKWMGCAIVLSNMTYVNSYNMEENPNSYFFEFKANWVTNGSKNEDGTLKRFETDRIDVYLCHKASYTTCELIIKDWIELAVPKASRFTGSNYFLQALATQGTTNVTTPDNKTEAKPSITVEFFMSTKRYKSKSRSIFNQSFIFDVPSVDFLFEEVNEIFYVFSPKFIRVFKIDQVKLKIKFTDFNSSTRDESTDLAGFKPKGIETLNSYWNSLILWSQFDLKFEDKIVPQWLAWTNRTTLGEYFFAPTSNMNLYSKPTLSETRMAQSSPMGIPLNYDITDLFRGSFIKLKSQNITQAISSISQTYLDSYRFKITVKKPKYLQDLYLVDTEIGDKRKVYLMVSTKTDNLIYIGNRFSTSMEIGLSNKYTMRDFRPMTDYYPINGTHGLMQIQELVYTVDPFSDKNLYEIPSNGVNGVCSNSTLVSHNKLGPLHFCIYEAKAYFKILIDNSMIVQMTMTTDTQDLLNRINKIRYIKKSDTYTNHVFLIYTKKAEFLKDLGYPNDFLFMATLRIDHKSDPRLVLIRECALPFNNVVFNYEFNKDFDTYADLYSLEIVGNKIVYVIRWNKEKGEHRIGILSLERGKNPEILNMIPLPVSLTIDSNLKLRVTNVPDESDIDLNQNSVVNSESTNYQICFKALNEDRETKVVVFNPQAATFSAFSIIDLPPSYKIIDFGPMFLVTKNKRTTSLAILAAKTANLDEDFLMKENELYIFMVTDMTPSLKFRPFKKANLIKSVSAVSTEDLYAANKECDFELNATSNIYSEQKILNNNNLATGTQQLFDNGKKIFSLMYESWGNKYDTGKDKNNVKSVSSINILSLKYVSDLQEDIKRKESNKERTLEPRSLLNLRNFFVRLIPNQFYYGHIFNYSGVSESSIEDFMGIIKVLSPNMSTDIMAETSVTTELKTITEKHQGSISLDWSCEHITNTSIKTNIEGSNLPNIRQCLTSNPIHVIANWEKNLYKLKGNTLVTQTQRLGNGTLESNDTRFDVKGFVLHDKYIFFVLRILKNKSSIRICRQEASLIDTAESNNTLDCKSSFQYGELELDSANLQNTSSLTIRVTPLEAADRYIISIIHYNNPMSIYTMAEIFDMNFPNTQKDKPTQGQANLIYLASVYVGSNNLDFVISATSTTSPTDAKISAVELNIAAVYYRWRMNTELVLMKDLMELIYIKNYTATGCSLVKQTIENATLAHQGFKTNNNVKGRLMKFATLLYSMKDHSNPLKVILESIRIWTPKKMLTPTFIASYPSPTDASKTIDVPVFKIVLAFQSSNSYFMHIRVDYLKELYRNAIDTQPQNPIFNESNKFRTLGGVMVNLSQYKIAPIENPFIGFTPDKDSPEPQLIDDYFFVANNYQDKPYFFFYSLNNIKMKQYPALDDKNISNIFGINVSLQLDATINKSMNKFSTIYSEGDDDNYVKTNLLIELSSRPLVISTIPNCNVQSHLEHCLHYINSDEKMVSINFTSFINIRVKSHKIASSKIFMNMTGKFGLTKNFLLLVSSDSAASLWNTSLNLISILLLVGFAALLTLATIVVIDKDVKITMFENKQIFSRHSVTPVLGIIGHYIEDKIIQPEEQKEEDQYSKSSDDSEDSSDELKKSLVSHKKEPETIDRQEPIQRSLENQPGLQGADFVMDPNAEKMDDDFTNPLK